MDGKDWLVTEDGKYQACKSARAWDLITENYRLYRFLTELEDILKKQLDENNCLAEIRQIVRKLLVNSYWVKTQHPEPDNETGTSVKLLYDELGFPFTVQTVTFNKGTQSNIHNHGTWGIVAVLKGQEKNTIWKRNPTVENPDKIQTAGEIILNPGDIVSFAPGAIHSVEAIEEPTVTFNLYGETRSKERFEFDTVNHTAKNF
ncbi:cupin domain-containing protein [Calothrix parasitica NIES-267]|uniref:Cupin domain-containing protein n=1 Tax=Calothrix parasitica NIES-267 TaxID=1973488 RepID=A0A1Z4LYF9_9CYAN|nr:cupin domain-containing protein [Calothrix parasitica NIES-267]